MNANWHRRHVMPTRPSLEQRVRWHLAHAKACGCRKIPRIIAAEIKRRDKLSTRRR
jgi:hypothetical protein